MLQMPEVSGKLVGGAIKHDVAMTAKLLQLVNSSFFGLRRHVSDPTEAVTLLGLDTVRSLVLTMQVFSQVMSSDVKRFSQDALLSHSTEVAALAKKLAVSEGLQRAEAEQVHLAGLLHDIGKLVLAVHRPEQFAEAIELARSDELSSDDAERQVVGAAHTEIGAYLLGLWAFEAPIVDAALYHHSPGRHCVSTFSAVTAVHVANAIVHAGAGMKDVAKLGLDDAHIDRLALGHRVVTWCEAHGRAA
jgi:putative nucleotidyltransferase with HDIG domain